MAAELRTLLESTNLTIPKPTGKELMMLGNDYPLVAFSRRRDSRYPVTSIPVSLIGVRSITAGRAYR